MPIVKDAEYLNFVRWCATPDHLKEYKTQKELAVAIKVSEPTLSHWRDRADFNDLRIKFLKQWGKDKTANVVAGLYRKAIKDGKAGEAKLWLQYMEDWQEKTQATTVNVQTDFKELDGRAKKIKDKYEEELKKTLTGE